MTTAPGHADRPITRNRLWLQNYGSGLTAADSGPQRGTDVADSILFEGDDAIATITLNRPSPSSSRSSSAANPVLCPRPPADLALGRYQPYQSGPAAAS